MRILLVLAMIAQVTVLPRGVTPPKDYPIRAVPLTSVRITDGFWAPKREVNRTVPIPHIMQQNELTGRVGPYQGQRYNDTDVYKMTSTFRSDLLNGVHVITGTVGARTITAVPYYAWNNRGKGEMAVWIPF